MVSFFLNWLLTGLLFLAAGKLFSDIHVSSLPVALVVAIVLGVANACFRPVISFLTFPINLVTLGLFSFVVNGLILMLVAMVVPGFSIKGMGAAILLSVALSVVNLLLGMFGWQSRML
jgi:putative membrane protein